MRRTTTRMRLVNALTAPASRARRDPDKVFDRLLAAQRSDPDGAVITEEDERSLEHLRGFLHHIAAVDSLSGVGWLSVHDMVKTRIGNLFHVRRLQARHPEARNERIEAPVFVIGLPRTATTLTHKILANAQGGRGPYMWEMDNIGLPRSEADEERLRRQTQRKLDQILTLSPSWGRIHPVRADWVEEIYFLLNQSRLHNTMAPMPKYIDFMRAYDARPDYRFVRDALQILQYRRPTPRWMLKHPDCLAETAAIHQVFPDAKFVWTHRDPHTVMGSMCSMAESLGYLHNRPSAVDPHLIGRTWLEILPDMVERARRERIKMPREATVDVAYHAMMADPFRYVPQLFEQLDLKWTDLDERNLGDALDRPRDQRGHEYSMVHYGLDPAMIDKAFGDYGLFVDNMTANIRR
ncbi:sulfotransferase family protein [Glycomyces harbinensis]|uniref:Sulfotransferase family protein n=1 Tax=Glycomyces harbinensis TaxID=58114 RepID=A0A1G6RRF8_9ACTN|nr:sulfotransferase [Glycomyces harbinensis]SDD07128.1 Sulfotransferase family protein [Glycomyces harbinensis]